ncbi:MAG: YedE-related selenium metabolism membrane protein, partial [Oscillospiraceae bacterium]
YAAVFVAAFVGNLIIGNVNFSFVGQPIAHTDFVWNFLGMTLVGFGSILVGGCPLRQVILSGEGNTDSAISVLGMLVGAAFAHNFGLASSADGSTPRGQIAVVIGLVILGAIAVLNTVKKGAKATA